MDPILDAIDAALKAKGMSDAAASLKAVGNPSLIKNMRLPREGEKRYSIPALERLAEVLGLELYFGPPRVAAQGFAEPTSTDDLAPPVAMQDHFLSIPWHGPGIGISSSPIAISTAWMHANALVPDRLRAVVPDVVDLEHVGPRGVVALIDARAKRRAELGHWCYTETGKTHLGLVTFAHNVIILSPARMGAPPRVILPDDAGQITILGKVVWLSFIVGD